MVGAANVAVQAGLPGGQVRSRREQLKWGSIVCRAGAGVQAWKTNKTNVQNMPDKPQGALKNGTLTKLNLHKKNLMATSACYDNTNSTTALLDEIKCSCSGLLAIYCTWFMLPCGMDLTDCCCFECNIFDRSVQFEWNGRTNKQRQIYLKLLVLKLSNR